MTLDLVIRGGTVVDGTGMPRYRGDVGVANGTIVSIGRITERGAEEIDAEGKVVAPGFIDGHTHFDAQVCWDPLGTSSSYHGVTSVIMGNCGFTIAPCREAEMDLALRSLERAEDMSRAAMLAGIEWRWETFADYFDELDRLPKGINYAGYIGHSALRTYVMGERAYDGPAGDDDVVAMTRELEAALAAGAIGFSTSRSQSHATADDRPVASRMADWSEVRALVTRMGELGGGVFELALEQFPDSDSRRPFLDRLENLAVDSGCPLTFITASTAAMPDLHRDLLALFDRAAAHGGRMFGQAHAREFLSITGFEVKLPFDQLAGWKELRRLSIDEQRRALEDPDRRRRLTDEALRGPYGNAIGAEARAPQYDTMRIVDRPQGPYRTVGELAAERGVSGADVMIDLALDSGMSQLFAQPFANQNMDSVLEILRHPHTVVAVSDSGAHVSQIVDSSVPTFLLSHWVRNEQAFTLEEGVRMLTLEPAQRWGLHDRGLVQQGRVADLVVFDPDTIAPNIPRAATDLPAGAKRLIQHATGVHATVVGGQTLLIDGEHTGALPGQVLRR
ncbi:MAG TPA: amidohydrolase family protein [Acidimicrobiales bacterium]|nr:amidohydrolase family protein [Acidimicrobiales bacterium]